MVLRLGEQYLVRAEARAQQGKVAESASDINIIRARAGPWRYRRRYQGNPACGY